MAEKGRARQNMVHGQLLPNGVSHKGLLDAFAATPRELFVPTRLIEACYFDREIEVDTGRFMLSPLDLATLIQTAKAQRKDSVFIVGCLTGYSAAILSHLAKKVFGVEWNKNLLDQSQKILKDLAIINVNIVEGTLQKGLKKSAPYDVILIEGVVKSIPDDLLAQLKDGGRLVTILESAKGMSRGVLVHKLDGSTTVTELFDSNAPRIKIKNEQEFEF